MRYDWRSGIGAEEFSKEFFREIDGRFFSDARVYMPWRSIPFDALIDFESLADLDVLEIGVGNGSHAQLLAKHARTFTGIDLTDYAVESTTARMKQFGLKAKIVRMDAEELKFPDNAFDFIWTWGVIHHSSNTRRILEEMHRVLRPGGSATVMVYFRSFWIYYMVGGFFHGILMGDLLKTRSLHDTVQRWTDGAMARFYSVKEWTNLVGDLFRVSDVGVFGSKAEIVPLPGGKVKNVVMSLFPDSLSRFVSNTCRQGMFLVSTLHKDG